MPSMFGVFGTTRINNRISEDKLKDDPLDLGKDSQPASAPTNWLVLMGPSSAGKTTLMRQLRLAHDGADVNESIRYVRETHKVALSVMQHVAKEALPALADDMKEVAERLLALRRRAAITTDVARDVKELWSCPDVLQVEDALVNPQMRKACQHYVSRVDALADSDYVPETLDLLHMAVPTVGRQEMRIQNFPGGTLSMFELTKEMSRSLVGQGGSDDTGHHESVQQLFGPGLRGIIFVASLVDFETSAKKRRTSTADLTMLLRPAESKDLPPLAPGKEALTMWRNAQNAAKAQGVPCFLVLSKRDLLDEVPSLPGDLSPATVEALLRSQYLKCKPVIDEPRHSGASGAEAPSDSRKSASMPTRLDPEMILTAKDMNLLDSDNDVDQFTKALMQDAFPELDFDEDATTVFGDAVHVCLTFFSSNEKTILSKQGTIPVAKWQSQTLTMADHTWLHELPKPIPNPKHVSDGIAQQMGKDSPNETRAQFWKAMCCLSNQLGSFEPKTLGFLNMTPLLTAAGALLIVFKQNVALDEGSFKMRSLKWKPVSQVAGRLAQVAQATELCCYRRDAVLGSYATDVRQMLAETPSRELMPSVWLEKLRLSCEGNLCEPMGPGTYVTSMVTHSTRDGLLVLVPDDAPSLPPTVKISDAHLSPDEWNTLCGIGHAAQSGTTPLNLPMNWSAAKGWMGPEVGTEKQFTMLQKFFYGVVALRQRLHLKCSAISDDLRYSQTAGASDSLAALGEMYTKEIVMADTSGKVQIIVILRHHTAAEQQVQYPKPMRWHPFNVFEAELFQSYMPKVHNAIVAGKELLHRGLAMQTNLNFVAITNGGDGKELRDSAASLRGSGEASAFDGKDVSSIRASLRKSLRSSLRLSDREAQVRRSLCQTTARTCIQVIAPTDEEALHSAWSRLRWTKHVVLSGTHMDEVGVQSTPLTAVAISGKPPSAKNRIDMHAKAVKETLKAMENAVKQTNRKVDELKRMQKWQQEAMASNGSTRKEK